MYGKKIIGLGAVKTKYFLLIDLKHLIHCHRYVRTEIWSLFPDKSWCSQALDQAVGIRM